MVYTRSSFACLLICFFIYRFTHTFIQPNIVALQWKLMNVWSNWSWTMLLTDILVHVFYGKYISPGSIYEWNYLAISDHATLFSNKSIQAMCVRSHWFIILHLVLYDFLFFANENVTKFIFCSLVLYFPLLSNIIKYSKSKWPTYKLVGSLFLKWSKISSIFTL